MTSTAATAPVPVGARERGRGARLLTPEAIAVAVLAVACVVAFFVWPILPTFDLAHEWLWGHDLVHGQLPEMGSYRAPTQHPLALFVMLFLGPLGDDRPARVGRDRDGLLRVPRHRHVRARSRVLHPDRGVGRGAARRQPPRLRGAGDPRLRRRPVPGADRVGGGARGADHAPWPGRVPPARPGRAGAPRGVAAQRPVRAVDDRRRRARLARLARVDRAGRMDGRGAGDLDGERPAADRQPAVLADLHIELGRRAQSPRRAERHAASAVLVPQRDRPLAGPRRRRDRPRPGAQAGAAPFGDPGDPARHRRADVHRDRRRRAGRRRALPGRRRRDVPHLRRVRGRRLVVARTRAAGARSGSRWPRPPS